MDITRLRAEAEEGVWIPIAGDDGELLCRRIDEEETKALRARARKTKLGGRRKKKGEIDTDFLSDLLLDACVRDWRKIGVGEEKLPVTWAHKKELNAIWPEFSDAWNTFLTDSTDQSEEEKEEELGNSSDGQSGSTRPNSSPASSTAMDASGRTPSTPA